MEYQQKKNLIQKSIFFQIFIGIVFFILSLSEKSTKNILIFSYNKEKIIFLLLFLAIITFFIILLYISKKINLAKFIINPKIYNLSLFILSVSTPVYYFIMQNLDLITYAGIIKKSISIFLWFNIILLNLLFLSINQYKKLLALIKKNWIEKTILFILNTLLFLTIPLNYTTQNPFVIFLPFLLVFIFLYQYKEPNKKIDTNLIISLILCIFLSLEIKYITISNDNFLSPNKFVSFSQFKPILLIFLYITNFYFILCFYNVINILKEKKFNNRINLKSYLPFFGITLIIAIVFSVLIYKFKFILIHDYKDWRGPANPITFFSIFIAIIFLLLFSKIISKYFSTQEKTTILLKIGIPLLLIIMCIVLWSWNFVSNPHHFLIIEPLAPNYSYYPGSDAQRMDIHAQLMRYGIPFSGDYDKPMTYYFSYLYHLILKENFSNFYYLQYVFMFLLPIGVFMIGKKLHSIEAGIIAAILVIFQEHNAIILSPYISNVTLQQQMSEIPTLLFIVWSTYFFLAGLKNHSNLQLSISGVLILFAFLSRGNPIFIFAFMVLYLFIDDLKNKNKFKKMLVFSSSFIVLLGIWYAYEFISTGNVYIIQKIINVFNRMMVSISFGNENTKLFSILPTLQQFQNNISGIISNLFNHTLNNYFGSFMFLPTKISIDFPIMINDISFKFWNPEVKWTGALSLQNILLILLNLSILTIGFGNLWKKNKFIAIIPLFICLSYMTSSGISNVSGGRYLTPISWITILYYSVGLITILYSLLNKPLLTNHSIKSSNAKKSEVFLLVFLVLFLFSMIILPSLQPFHDTSNFSNNQEKWIEAYQQNHMPLSELIPLLEDPSYITLDTIAFYPLINNQILSAKIIIEKNYNSFFFPIQKHQSVSLPHDAEIITIGKMEKGYFVAYQYAIQNDNGQWDIYTADPNNLTNIKEQVNWMLY